MKLAFLQLWQHKSHGSPEEEAGCSLHLTNEDHQTFTKKYWEHMPKKIPQHYDTEFGGVIGIEVSDALYRKIEKARGEAGLRLASLPREIQELVPTKFTSPNEWKKSHILIDTLVD